jgi:membrane associated rhomboid family serine protease
MIPLRDNNPRRRTPAVTITLIIINVLVFLYEMLLQSQGQIEPFVIRWSVIPAELTNNFVAEIPTLVTSMFLHGGWAHLLGNMLYLWIFGDNIEDRLGPVRFILFYLLTGFLATAAQVAVNPSSPVPNLGASGAIAGVLGGYILEFPRARVTTLVFRFFAELPAIVVLGLWFVFEFFRGVTSLGTLNAEMGGVAFFAHIGGFIAGLVLIKLFQVGLPPPAAQTDWGYRRNY